MFPRNYSKTDQATSSIFHGCSVWKLCNVIKHADFPVSRFAINPKQNLGSSVYILFFFVLFFFFFLNIAMACVSQSHTLSHRNIGAINMTFCCHVGGGGECSYTRHCLVPGFICSRGFGVKYGNSEFENILKISPYYFRHDLIFQDLWLNNWVYRATGETDIDAIIISHIQRIGKGWETVKQESVKVKGLREGHMSDFRRGVQKFKGEYSTNEAK